MESKAYRTYLEEEKAWLADYALYMAVKDSFDGKSWDQWEEDILSLIHISEPPRRAPISYAVFFFEKKKKICSMPSRFPMRK